MLERYDLKPEECVFLDDTEKNLEAAEAFALYIATFLTAILDTPGSGSLFRTCLGATIVLPTLLWMYLWLYGRIKEREKDI